jgi:hypothetical protein
LSCIYLRGGNKIPPIAPEPYRCGFRQEYYLTPAVIQIGCAVRVPRVSEVIFGDPAPEGEKQGKRGE